MGLKRFICLIFVFVAGLTGLLWFTLSAREPSYLGQPLSFWLSGNWVSHTPMELAFIRDNKDAALRQMGPSAVPTLVRWLRAHDSPFELKLQALAQRQSYLHFHWFSDVQKHRLATDGFVAINVTAHSALPAVLEIAQHGPDHDSRMHANFVLSCLGAATEQDIPALVRAAACTNSPDTQRYAIQFLGRIHTRPTTVVPALLNALKTTSGQMHTDIIVALCQMPAEPRLARPLVSAMVDVLQDTNTPSGLPVVAACRTLGLYGTNAAPALPALFEFLKSAPPEDSSERKFAVDTILKIDPQAATTRAAELQAALREPAPAH